MALLLTAAAGALSAAYALNQQDKNKRELDAIVERAERTRPQSADWESRGALASMPLPQRPVIVPDVDLHGVPVYHIDTGAGSFARFYAAPDGLEISVQPEVKKL